MSYLRSTNSLLIRRKAPTKATPTPETPKKLCAWDFHSNWALATRKMNGVALDLAKPLTAIHTPITTIAIHHNMRPVCRWTKHPL